MIEIPIIISLHIFIFSDDILDRISFLNSYVNFMRENFRVVNEIAIRVTNFPQSGSLYGANMFVTSVVFFVCLIFSLILRLVKKEQPMNTADVFVGALRSCNIFVLIFIFICLSLLVYVDLYNFYIGNFFELEHLSGKKLSENYINNKQNMLFIVVF